MTNEIFDFFNEKIIDRYGIDVTMSKSRQQPRPTIRRAIINILDKFYGYDDGYTAKMIGLDRSTVLEHRHLHEDTYHYQPLYAEIYDYLESCVAEKASFLNMEEILSSIKSLVNES